MRDLEEQHMKRSKSLSTLNVVHELWLAAFRLDVERVGTLLEDQAVWADAFPKRPTSQLA